MEDIHRKQAEIFDALTKLFSNIKKDSSSRKVGDYFKRRLEILENYWSDFQYNHDRIKTEESRSHPYFVENHYERAVELYRSIKALIHQQQGLIKAGPSAVSDIQERNPVGLSQLDERAEEQSQESQHRSPVRLSRGTSSKTEDMLKKQASNFRAFERTISNIKLDDISEKWALEDALKTLETRWSTIDSLHWELDVELQEPDSRYEQLFSQYENTYNNLKKAINIKLWSVVHKVRSTPKMDIPNFSGSFQQWTSFKDLFTETIHNNSSLSNAQKMQYLKSKLRGEAERLIQHLAISSDNYNISWNIINHRYNNARLICSSHIDTLLNIPVIQNPTVNNIKRLHDTTIESLNAIKNLGIEITSWDPLLIHLLAPKLDSETYNDYSASIKDPRSLPTIQDFLSFLESKFTSMESSRKKFDTNSNKSNTSGYKQHKTFIAQGQAASSDKNASSFKYKCLVCKKNEHGIYYCPQFLEMSPQIKRKTLLKLDVCHNCLNYHKGYDCLSNKRCRQCNGNHNTLLHEAFAQSNRTSNAGANSSKNATNNDNVTRDMKPMLQQSVRANSNASLCKNLSEVLLPTAMVRVQAQDGTFKIFRALLDQGSQISLINEHAAQALGIPRQRSPGIICGIGEKENHCKGIMSIKCSSINGEFEFEVDAFIMNKLVKHLPNRTFPKPSWPYLENITLADVDFNVSRPVDLLLSSSVYSKILLDGVCRATEESASAQNTRLGWILSGDITQSFQCNVILHNLDEIKKYWEIEDIAETTPLSSGDQRTVDFYQKTTTRLEDGRYQVRLPLQENFGDKLGLSKPRAIAQYKSLERKFQQQPNIQKQYQNFMQEYQELGHMIASESSLNSDCFLTHHSIQRSESSSTKFRVVFNASTKTTSGKSLNDVMEAGPNLQQDLQSLIIRWRQFKFAFTADIEKMFRQIWVHKDDQRLQKIIWRNSPSEPIQEFQLTTVTYGTKAAPFLAMMTLKQLAYDERNNYPNTIANKVLEHSFYMDDLVHGTHSPETAKLLTNDLIKLLKSGGFHLRKWKTNISDLFEQNKNQDSQDSFNFKQEDNSKTLGLIWNPKSDTFMFQYKIDQPVANKPITKRLLLSQISKIFDPLGWLSPLSTKLKIIFQNVWLRNMSWDDFLPDDVYREWATVQDSIHQINQIKIPRWLQTAEHGMIELHGFCDASLKAYASVIYCRIVRDDKPEVILLTGKTRLVPISKSVSLPRLELLGALLLSKLMIKVKECLSNYQIKTYGWSDSTIVLAWLNGGPSKWKTFVANRVQQVTTIMPSECWRYVKSSDNPADCASRGLTAGQLKEHSLWWKGPSWLLGYDAERKLTPPTFLTDEEIKPLKKLQVSHITHQCDDIISELIPKYSSLSKLVHVYAWVLRFTSKLRLKHNINTSYLTIQEIKQAKLHILRHVQRTEFLDEILQLEQNKPISNKSSILSLTPFIDKDEILRVGGRLKHANVSFDMKHPIILPKNSHFTNLIIEQSHMLTFHGGPQLTSALIRQKYWITGGLRAIKKQLRHCVKCRRYNPSNQHQIMGNLPSSRVNPSRPFQNVGVDYTGHIYIKSSKGRGIKTTKGYVAVFICMATKAVHLELVSDLTASAFIAALRRMIARRGLPSDLYSDQGTNFIGANNILQQEYKEIQRLFGQELQSEIAKLGIEWHFNAPSWPSAGGLWEAAVKSLKYHLKRVVGEQKLTFEEFSTLLYQLEACLNSRPLCPLTEDATDLNYLTPAHFLSSGPNLTLYETEKDLRTRWNLTQRIYQDIWKRWRDEYLHQLNKRSKWRCPRDNIKTGDIVLVHETNLPPGRWAMGRVIQTHPGSDGFVRVVTLQTENGVMKRPIVKLTILPISAEKKDQSDPTDRYTSTSSTTSRPERTTKSKKFSYHVLMSLLFFVMTAMCNVNAIYNLTKTKDNQAIYFDKISEMHLIQDHWKIVVYYNMEPYWHGTRIYNIYYKHLENLCTQQEERPHCHVIMLQLRHLYSELEYYDRMLLNQHFTASTRVRRGLINGIGYIAGDLFGVLDERFAEKYQRDIALVRRNQKHMESLWKNQTSVIEAENNLLKRMASSIEKQHKIFNKHLIKLDQNVDKLKNEVEKNHVTEDFTLSTIIANNILTSLKNIQETLLDTISNVQHFNVHLITPAQLQDELNIISNQLPKDLSLPVNNVGSDLYKIYQIMQVKARMTNKFFIFEIQIPIINRESYDLYRLIPIRYQVKTTMVNVVPIADYLALNIKTDTYLPISEKEFQNCYHFNSNTNLCQIQKPIYRRDTDQNFCVSNQGGNACLTVTSTCETVWTELNVVNSFIMTCCNDCLLNIICRDQVTSERITGVNIISLGDSCVIKGKTFIITSHSHQTIDMNIKPDFVAVEIPPVNNLINLSTPVTDHERENSNYQTSLQNISQQIELLKTASEKLDDDDEVSSHDIHHYAAIYCVAAAGIAFGAYAYVRARQRFRDAPALPLVHYRTSIERTRASGVNEQSDQCVRAPLNQSEQCASAINNPNPCVVNRATSPIVSKCSFKTSLNNIDIEQ